MSPPRVTVLQGQLKGKSEKTADGFTYNCFQGIPYGEPPVGKLRFKDPRPAAKWVGVRDCSREGNICAQLEPNKIVSGSEDCLFLNVYTPALLGTGSLIPVMVWVHGGGFYKGSGSVDKYGPDFLIEKNIVFVSINYRLSVLGFLCLNTPDVPGNAGLKDQVLALRWVQNNIQNFGGDPNNVTIFGESAGAVSIQHLALSQISRGLFHKAIIQSGSALCDWSMMSNPLTYAFKLAASLGYDSCDKNSVFEFLQKVPVDDLLKHSSKIMTVEDTKKLSPCAFLPVLEEKFDNIESVINTYPEETIVSSKFDHIPLMAGYSSKEALFLLDKISFDEKRVSEIVNDCRYFIPSAIYRSGDTEKILSAVKELEMFYFHNAQTSSETLHSLMDLLSDFLFRHPIDLTVKLLANYSKAPVYYFQFSYFGNLNRYKERCLKLNVKGAVHSEEAGYLFRTRLLESEEVLPQDKLVRQRLVEMWTNFAKFGNPTPGKTELLPVIWKRAAPGNINFMEINENLISDTDPNSKALNFWNRLRNNQ